MKLRQNTLKRAVLGAACGAFALPMVAYAGDGPYIGVEGGANWEAAQKLEPIAGLGGPATLKFKHPFDAGYIGGLTFGYGTAIGLRPELELDYRRNDLKSVDNITGGISGYENAYTAMGNLWYDIKTKSGIFSVVHPYLGGGAGGVRFALRDDNTGAYAVKFGYQGGAGIGFDLTPHLTLSADWRYLQSNRGRFEGADNSNVSGRYRSQSGMLGVRYSFGSPPPPPAPPPPPPPPLQPTPPPPPPVVDSDGDGVPDNLDRCPGTPHGFKVDATGCIIEQTVVLRAVNFEFNSDQLTLPSQQTLDEVAAALNGQPGLSVQIGGYTDSVGSASYNLKLSQKRADSVRRYLVSKNVAPSNLVAKGFGKANPVASNDTDEGRTENRRVEFVVLNKPATVKVIDKGSTEQSKAAAESGGPAPKHHAKHKPATTGTGQ